MQVIILAAGRGSRLGRALPKPLTELADGRTILQQQLDNLAAALGPEAAEIQIVVGHGLDHVIEAHPDLPKVYNEEYAWTNTSKSLLRALHRTPHDEGALWINGDLVFHPGVLALGQQLVEDGTSYVTVNRAKVSDEEVKYTIADDGSILALSKTVPLSLAAGEAIGINYVSAADKGELLYWLARVHNEDYFERAIELAVSKSKVRFLPVDVGAHYAVEVDFESDLVAANRATEASTSPA